MATDTDAVKKVSSVAVYGHINGGGTPRHFNKMVLFWPNFRKYMIWQKLGSSFWQSNRYFMNMSWNHQHGHLWIKMYCVQDDAFHYTVTMRGLPGNVTQVGWKRPFLILLAIALSMCVSAFSASSFHHQLSNTAFFLPVDLPQTSSPLYMILPEFYPRIFFN